ncbi:MAG: septum formation inhibitor Maf [Gammaproteobacteria bacterium]|nr:septum formation inhibitor Maf [Gammaproteobacteria bacterium]NVK88252.1 septum formation inhibitor Maf [Gammaproteobacteria bacterium]
MAPLPLPPKVKYPSICLASQSPRRKALLQQLGVQFAVMPADIDETKAPEETPLAYVERVTLAKARAVWQAPEFTQDQPILASDTAVVLDQTVLGKPQDELQALAMYRQLANRTHLVITGVALVMGDQFSYQASQSEVTFRQLSEAEMLQYWRTGEGQDKAGGYAIQGLAASFIEHISGSFSGVMGLPLFETANMLEQWGVAFWLNSTVKNNE